METVGGSIKHVNTRMTIYHRFFIFFFLTLRFIPITQIAGEVCLGKTVYTFDLMMALGNSKVTTVVIQPPGKKICIKFYSNLQRRCYCFNKEVILTP